MIRIRNRILKVEKYGKNKKSNIKGKKDKWKLKNKYQISLILNNIWYLCNEVIHMQGRKYMEYMYFDYVICTMFERLCRHHGNNPFIFSAKINLRSATMYAAIRTVQLHSSTTSIMSVKDFFMRFSNISFT